MQRTITTTSTGAHARVTRVRWGAVFAGGVLAAGLLVLISSFWLALGYGSNSGFVVDNLKWFMGGSVIVCLLIGGFVAGRLSGVPGVATGMAHGLTLWALMVLVTLSVGIPSILNVLNLGRISTRIGSGAGVIAQGVASTLWTGFIALLGALGAAAVGGMIGGASARSLDAGPEAVTTTEHVDAEPDRGDPVVVPERRDEVSPPLIADRRS